MHIVPNAGETDHIITGLDENKYLFEHYDYTLRMANVPEELNAAECNMQTTLHATQSTKFDLYNGCGQEPLVKGFLPNVEGLCPNNLYTLHSMIENVMAPKTGTTLQPVRGSVMADWLVGFEFDDIYADTKSHDPQKVEAAKAAFEAKYGYSRAAIKTALLYDLRRPSTEYDKNCNINATSFEELDINCFQEKVNYYIIKDLYERGLLQIGKRTSTFYLGSNQTARYWIYPIDGTAKGKIGDTEIILHDCSEPIWVMVSSKEASAELNISPLTEAQKTDLLDEYPTIMQDMPTVRVRKSELNGSITVPVTESTVDGVNQGSKLVINLDNVKFYNIETDEPIVRPANLEIGQKYTVCTTFDLSLDICPDQNNPCKDLICFNILVLPDAVIWEPAAGSYNGWGLDENWRGWDDKNSNGIIDDGEKMSIGFVPIAGSDVIIPTLPDVTLYPYVHDHNHYPMDVNAHPSICNNIYFAPGAHIHNQHLLQYEKAYVDMQITAGKWNMMSAPLQNMVSGDMYIPHKGMYYADDAGRIAEPNAFQVSHFQGLRHRDAAYLFYQQFYNQTVYMHHEDGTTSSAASIGFEETNSLSQPLLPGSGYSLYGVGLTGGENLIIRLPKPDTQYKYYTSEGNPSDETTTVDRGTDNQSHKFAFPADHESDEMTITLTNQEQTYNFLFGNPTMAFIDMQLFLKDNAAVLNPVFHRIEASTWVASTELTLTQDRYLAPMSSVMLEKKGQAPDTELSVTLKAEHLTLNNIISAIAEEPSAMPQRIAAQSESRANNSEILTIYAFTPKATARTVLATNPVANDYYQVGEDALFVSSGIENKTSVKSPLNMYTVAEQVPMMADVRQGISRIPLSFLVDAKSRTETMQLAFYISENWTRECYLVDSITGQRIRIMDGLCITVPMPLNHEQRYFIEGPDDYNAGTDPGTGDDTGTAVEQVLTPNAAHKMWAYAPDRNNIIISASDVMKSVTLYDITGRALATLQPDLLSTQLTMQATVQSGVYIVAVTFRDNTTAQTQIIVP